MGAFYRAVKSCIYRAGTNIRNICYIKKMKILCNELPLKGTYNMRCKKMDKAKVDEIYQKNATVVYKYLCGLTQNAQLAEELTQETFFQAIRGIDKYRGECKISVWLCQIAKRLWYKELKKRNKHNFIELDDTIVSDENVEYDCINQLEKVEIFRLMHNLDDVTREVMYLRLSGDLKFSEVAEIMGKTENWARVTYYRGKQQLMKGMRK